MSFELACDETGVRHTTRGRPSWDSVGNGNGRPLELEAALKRVLAC
jgi:hypothetical protein